MSITSFTTVRVGEMSRTVGASRVIARTQAKLAVAQNQVATGMRVTRPSDDPADAAVAQQLRRTLEARAGYTTNLTQADRLLSQADTAIGEVTELLREARTIGLANIGDSASDAERLGAAEVLRTIERQLLTLANTNAGGVALFGGGRGTTEPFLQANGGVKYVGGDGQTSTLVGDNGQQLDLLVGAKQLFGSVSRRVGDVDLGPQITPDTRLNDLAGARGQGIERGSIRITNAGASAIVDLTDADTVGDVINRINATGIGVTAAIAGGPLVLTGTSITVGEVGQGTAADLGLLQSSPSPSVGGPNLERRLTVHTPLADLHSGAGIDTAGGFEIFNGTESDVISLAGLTTVGDLLNVLNASKASVSAAISADGSTLQLRNPVQGTELRVVEGTGTTAADLGWLTFTATDTVAELNGDRGLRLDPNGPDLRLVDRGNVAFEENLEGATTIQNGATAINAAATAAGATTTASFDPTVPGLILTNVGSATSVGESNALTDLGLDGEPTAGTLTGRDVNPVTSEGVFGHLRGLIAALENNDTAAASRAMADLEVDEQSATSVRGEVGGRLREVQQRQDRLADSEIVTRDLLSRLEEVDYPSAVLEYQMLQTSLQAQLQTTAQLLGLSLFDFLR